jgi:hypothetical protein
MKYDAILLTGILLWPLSLLSQHFTLIDSPENPMNTVNISGFYRGCAWVDIDNDYDLDLSLQGYLFRNEGADNFSVVSSFANGNPANTHADFLGGLSWADFDNDGDPDCLYSCANLIDGSFKARTFIYENDGKGNFSEKLIDTTSGISLKTWSASFADYNNDGYVDITGAVAYGFLGGLLDTPGFFYEGSKEGVFKRKEGYEFTEEHAPYTVAYWMDYDEDGDQDLFMASGPGGTPGPDFHYQNQLKETGTAQLLRITEASFAKEMQDGQAYNLIDYDLDGDLDLMVTNYSGASNHFYEYQAGQYMPVQNALTVEGPMLGNCWGDLDNDGDQDVILTSDDVSKARLYYNEEGKFIDAGAMFNQLSSADTFNISGLTLGDYDNDGDLDIFVNGGVRGGNGPRGLYRNDLDNDHHWVIFKCEGVTSNRSALGARLRLKTLVGGQPCWQQREITAQNTFMGHNSLRAHFGLGNADIIEELIVEWPSGKSDRFRNIRVNALYHLTEGVPILKQVEGSK